MCACTPMKTPIFFLILGLISEAGSETDIKWNRLPKSSLIDYTEPWHGEEGERGHWERGPIWRLIERETKQNLEIHRTQKIKKWIKRPRGKEGRHELWTIVALSQFRSRLLSDFLSCDVTFISVCSPPSCAVTFARNDKRGLCMSIFLHTPPPCCHLISI